MLRFFNLGTKTKPQPQQEYITHSGLALFYEQTLTNIKQNVIKSLTQNQNGKPSKQVEQDEQIETLKNSCESVLLHMKQVTENESNKEKRTEIIEREMKAEINYYFEPLHHALRPIILSGSNPNQQPTIYAMHEQVIDCVQQLFLYGYIVEGIRYTSDIPVENVSSQPHIMLIDVIVKLVCDCFSAYSSLPKKSNNVQLMIIKAMLTGITSCGMHGRSLRRAITTCLNIYLVNRDSVVLETAKASLSQMVNSVFRSMVDHQTEYDPSSVTGDEIEEQEIYLQIRQEEQLLEEKDVSEMTESERIVHDFVTQMFEHVAQEISESSTEYTNGETTTTDSKHKHLLSKATKISQNYYFQNMYEKDAFYLLRQLLQLSLRKKSDVRNPISVNAIHISLEFILDILRKYSDAILASGKGKENLFLRDIKYMLCLSLIKNAISSPIALFELSVRILEVLFKQGFVTYLRSELPSLFLSFLLRCLGTENSSVEQKIIVLNTFQSCIAKDGQLLVDLFANYDCMMHQENVFEAIIRTLCDLCRNIKAEIGWLTQSQEQKIRNQALQVICIILQSMVKFMNENQILQTEIIYETQMIEKAVYSQAAKLFNEKPEKGIKFLIDSGKIVNPAEDSETAASQVAKFLYDNRNTILNRKMIGEYLGGRDPFPSLARRKFTELQSFKDISISAALRSYLNTFRLPGEGQIVERYLEAFSKHYYNETLNVTPQIFANEDAVYLVAYSMLMLNTELHSPAFQMRERMGEPLFVASLSGQNGNGDFPDGFISGIYHDIKNNEIKMEGEELIQDPLAAYSSHSLTLARKRQIIYDYDTRRAYKKEKRAFNKSILKYAKKNEPLLFNAKSKLHVKNMLKTSFKSLYDALCDILKRFEDEKTLELCLNMYNSCIHIAARFELDEEREAFVLSLADFSKLSKMNVVNNVEQLNLNFPPPQILTQKNLDCMKLLLTISDQEGDYLKQSWQHVLQCISELERLRGLSDTEPSQQEEKKHRRTASMDSFHYLSIIIKKNIKPSSIDSIFNNTVKLSNEAFLYFAEALCKISEKELNEEEPRMYSLDRLVEIISANLAPTDNYARIRAVWSQLWRNSLFNHYMRFATGENIQNSLKVIGSLRQLASKLLVCDQLAQEETFQQNYLKPFHEIIQQSENNAIREAIIECVGLLAMKFSKSIECGWSLILHTLSWSNRVIANSNQKNRSRKKYTEAAGIIQLGFQFTTNILQEPIFSFVCRNDAFVACVSCLSAFAKQQLLPQVALRAIELLTDSCAKQIVAEKVIPLHPIEGEPSHVRFSEKVEIHGQIWRPILLQLGASASEIRIEMRIRSLETLFKLLKESGKLYSSGFWVMVFKDVLFPIFNEVTAPNTLQEKVPPSPTTNRNSIQPSSANDKSFSDSEWIRTTCHKAMICLVELFAEYFDTISFMLKDVAEIICACFKKDKPTDILCQIGNGCMHQLVSLAGSKFSSEHWDLICNYLTQSTKLMDAAFNFYQYATTTTSNTQDYNFLATVTIQCRAQLLLLDTCNDILTAHYNNMKIQHIQKLLQILLTSYTSARILNTSEIYSISMKTNVSTPVPLSEFITQETKSLTLYLNNLFKMIADKQEAHQEHVQLAHKLLIPLLDQLLRRFLYQIGVHKLEDAQDKEILGTFINPKETEALIPVVVLALKGFSTFSQEQFEQYIYSFYPLFCDLIIQTADKNNEIRSCVKTNLLRCHLFLPRK
jgi:brefeldin A-inhibited guanine nucleotide-exchange protein